GKDQKQITKSCYNKDAEGCRERTRICEDTPVRRNFPHADDVPVHGAERNSYIETDMQRRTIMIVDEMPDHRHILRRLLNAQGYRVLEAEGGADALDQARVEQPDLILMELSLPGHPGWETPQLLHNQPALAQTPILGTSVYNTLLTAPRVRALGCVDF